MISFFKKKICPPGSFYGGYVIVKFLGEGRFGICYLVELNGRQYVLKEIKPKIMKRQEYKILLEKEILASINHPSIPKIFDIIKNGRTYAYIMEYKKGKTLEDMIFNDMYKFNQREIYKIGIEIINIMQYLHERNIVHRDIRIPNVIIDKNRISLVDFGLARHVDNIKYKFYDDFSYFGHLLLYLYYSSFVKKSRIKKPWYEELELSHRQINFLKKLFDLNGGYKSIYGIKEEFLKLYSMS
ncbi:MAG: protein kinase [Clostridium sp.]|jgi:serine/threonine-protein kinase|uniref:serine/threonine protein kinase n=1 Tax=Clostridium sp. TaxID=1506 RepID=UPI0025BFC077|nr:protein kinase [Clostridium sp.]MCH3963367.1 protein kinase [Clostridium sp.]MCI1716765.1 protein kinase [Clostridium sp.]MCI1801051.1 protein kinase [Clostridium sp.]MCI1814951.1 protein kinase [Clostridium sp.]MCI1871852.1 protein kinase [Clostridium sp.]